MAIKLRRLNGWQRIGVVMSIAWFLVVGDWANMQVINGASWVWAERLRCQDRAEGLVPQMYGRQNVKVPAKEDCDRDAYAKWNRETKGHWWAWLVAGLAPLPFLWATAYGLIGLAAWIRRGFSTS